MGLLPRFTPRKDTPQRDVIASEAKQSPLTSMGSLRRCAPLNDIQSLQSSFLHAIENPAGKLCAAILAMDLESCSLAASHLAGLGTGLTPSGDDFLLGATCAAWMLFPASQARAIGSVISIAASPRTTRLSSAWLSAAARGEFSAPWHPFLDALASGHQAALARAALSLLEIGHTSGADALAGFLAVLNTGVFAPLFAPGRTPTALRSPRLPNRVGQLSE
jgi:hypothetical protein